MEAPEQEISCQALEVSDKSVEQDLNDEKKEENIVVQKAEQVGDADKEKEKEKDPLNEEKLDEKDQGGVLLDFSELFKKGGTGKMPTLQHRRQSNKTNKKVEEKSNENTSKEEIIPKDDEISSSQNNPDSETAAVPVKKNEIPKNLTITQEEMQQRKYLDQRRWFCLSRPQYQRSCGISSLMSCWNYLYSTLGTGSLPPISVEEALQILGVEREGKLFADTDFGDFTGNSTLIKWFKLLCRHFKVDGTAYIFWKVCGDNKTQGVDSNEALFQLEEGLRNENMTFIYHAYDHYFCPMGYEIVPRKPTDAYKKLEDIDPNEVDHWIFIGEPSKRFPAFHIKPWEEISKDISLGNPQYYDIRRPDKGIMERKGEYYRTKVAGTSIHCIMAFQRIIKKKRAVTDPKVKQEIQKKTKQQPQPTIEDLIAEEKLENIEAKQEAIEVKEQEEEENKEKVNNVIEVKNEEIQTIEIVERENQCVIGNETKEAVVTGQEIDEKSILNKDNEKDQGGQQDEKQLAEKEEQRKQDEEVTNKLAEIHNEEIEKIVDNKNLETM